MGDLALPHLERPRVAVPGLVLAALLAGGAHVAAATASHLWSLPLSAVPVALLGGMALSSLPGATARVADQVRPGIDVAATRLLRVAIVLLGLRFGLGELVAAGRPGLVVVVSVLVVAGATVLVLARALSVPTRLATRLGIGTAICGNSAIAAAAPVIDAERQDVAFSSVLVTLMGTAAMLVYPLVGTWLGLDAQAFGMMAGAGIHDSAQAIASGFAHSDQAGGVATLVKLTRVVFLVPSVIVMGWLVGRSGSPATEGRGPLPLFVVGFVLAATARSLGDAWWADSAWWARVLDIGALGASWLLLVAMAGVGLGSRLRDVAAVGWRPVTMGVAAALVTSLTALATVMAVT